MLSIELQHLVEFDFNIELTGFSTAEFDGLVDEASSSDDAADRLPEEEFLGTGRSAKGAISGNSARIGFFVATRPRASSFGQLLGIFGRKWFLRPALQSSDRRQCLRHRANSS